MRKPLDGMNQVLAYLGLALFAVLPPAVLVARYRLGGALPWLAVLVGIAGGGWFFVNFANYFYGQVACEAVRGVLNPTEEALARCTNDGARNVFTFLLGWLYALIYSVPFFVLFGLAAWARRQRSKRARHAV
jgi:hypothetical protein